MTDVTPDVRPRHLGALIRRAQQVHVALWSRDVSDRLSSVQYAVLELLTHLPGSSQKTIGDELGLDRSTVADVVRRMEAAGLLDRTRDPDDHRRNVVVLTDGGRSEYTALTPAVLALQHELVRELSADETAELGRLISRVLATHERRDDDAETGLGGPTDPAAGSGGAPPRLGARLGSSV